MYVGALARRIDGPGDHICGSGAVRRRRRRVPSAPLSGIVIAMDDHPPAMRLPAMREPGREPDREPDAPPDVGAAAIAWTRLLAIAKDPGADATPAPGVPEASRLLELYGPLCHAPAPFVVAHLGQTLDGRIATVSGASRFVTGHEDILHNHRMRALFDVVLVGAGTVRADDPQLTVRHCAGDNPVREIGRAHV